MSLTNAYLVTTKNMEAFFNAIRSAKAPERFTNKFLTQLDFTSSNDRLYTGMMKALGLIDDSGVPTKRYYAFLDQSESGRVLSEAIKEAYEDLFAVNKKAYELSLDDIRNKLKTLTQGQKSDSVILNMANTFKALASYADWSQPQTKPPENEQPTVIQPMPQPADVPSRQRSEKPLQLHYDIHVHLPESRDPAVFDAIFEAMRKHLSA